MRLLGKAKRPHSTAVARGPATSRSTLSLFLYLYLSSLSLSLSRALHHCITACGIVGSTRTSQTGCRLASRASKMPVSSLADSERSTPGSNRVGGTIVETGVFGPHACCDCFPQISFSVFSDIFLNAGRNSCRGRGKNFKRWLSFSSPISSESRREECDKGSSAAVDCSCKF